MAEKQNTQFSPVQEIFIPNIKIIGVGGAGGNVVTQMAEENLDQVETIICNTDIKALKRNKSHKKIELGRKLTRGMGAGARPEVGEGAAEESISEISEAVRAAIKSNKPSVIDVDVDPKALYSFRRDSFKHRKKK